MLLRNESFFRLLFSSPFLLVCYVSAGFLSVFVPDWKHLLLHQFGFVTSLPFPSLSRLVYCSLYLWTLPFLELVNIAFPSLHLWPLRINALCSRHFLRFFIALWILNFRSRLSLTSPHFDWCVIAWSAVCLLLLKLSQFYREYPSSPFTPHVSVS